MISTQFSMCSGYLYWTKCAKAFMAASRWFLVVPETFRDTSSQFKNSDTNVMLNICNSIRLASICFSSRKKRRSSLNASLYELLVFGLAPHVVGR